MMPRLFWVVLRNGKLLPIPIRVNEDDPCGEFCAIGRSLCIGLSATACAMATELWLANIRPSDRLHSREEMLGWSAEPIERIEHVLLFAEESGGKKARLLPIVRTDADDFFGFGETIVLDLQKARGEVPAIFPRSAPSKAERELARKLVIATGLEKHLSVTPLAATPPLRP